MRGKIDIFLPCSDVSTVSPLLSQLRNSRIIQQIVLLASEDTANVGEAPENTRMVAVDNMFSSKTIRSVAENVQADYTVLYLKNTPLLLGANGLERMLCVAAETDAAMVYADRYAKENGVTVSHPVIDYQDGSVRDDFDFGSLLLIKSSLIRDFVCQQTSDYKYAGLYELRLFLSRNGSLFHLNEYLYTEEEDDTRDSGVKQFDYVNPANRDVQIEMEQAVTAHLTAIGALVNTAYYKTPDFNEQVFEYEASVVIPVRNRDKTIADAVLSALGQKTKFPFNVIVVDNHSTDDTTRILEDISKEYAAKSAGCPQLIHIIPDRNDLGIGGCWNVAVNDSRCGRFAVQLDSDDLYSSPDTLQTIVDAFYSQKAAMVIGSYRMCDFELNTLPPGLISHAEWTEDNGCNNALRINGLGAPRAFFTPLLRQIQLPNTSYGEDYAMGLAFSRRYKIGRIYDELYLCRRWGGNSDSALSVEKVNANNLYKDRLRTIEIKARQHLFSGKDDVLVDDSLHRFFTRQLETWEDARKRYRDLKDVKTKELVLSDDFGEERRGVNEQDGEDTAVVFDLKAQYNPARIVSTGASIDKNVIAKRQCFLCESNRPQQQITKRLCGGLELLVNPFPILNTHFTIPSHTHKPQAIKDNYGKMYDIIKCYPELMVFYNGPRCGASAPDHMHFQAGASDGIPMFEGWHRLSRNLSVVYSLSEDEDISVVNDYPCAAFLIRSKSKDSGVKMFNCIYESLTLKKDDTEPMMNIVTWMHDNTYLSVIFPRGKHRPDCYYHDTDRLMVSPGALDMAGLIITPREEDFERIDASIALSILREVSLPSAEMETVIEKLRALNDSHNICTSQMHDEEPNVHVGIVSAEKLTFSLNSPYMAKGEVLTGEQTVEFSEGGILWNGNKYRNLKFSPNSDDASFSLHDVTIGVNFHWERKEKQTFEGTLLLIVEADKICAINCLPVERYLVSVISSEMSATSSIEFLKAHAVISRSWLLAQMKKRSEDKSASGFFSFVKKDDELIKWYDRDDHTVFDVCADDHCQRYQGITKAANAHVTEAVKATRGQILKHNDVICDARFSKCCGGETEEYQYCWEDEQKPYLVSIRDAATEDGVPFCNTKDAKILKQVLNDYDQETHDFYRWTVSYTASELAQLIQEKLGMDLGDIIDLVPVERGKSGRISKLRIVGSLRTFTIGKELEIRRVLSRTHLYSSAFDVEKTHDGFVLNGKGWGHGVGLCQIGAAVMGERGYKYDDILLHYYRGAEIKKAW